MLCDQLHESSKIGRLDDMRELLNDGADIEFKDEVRPLRCESFWTSRRKKTTRKKIGSKSSENLQEQMKI